MYSDKIYLNKIFCTVMSYSTDDEPYIPTDAKRNIKNIFFKCVIPQYLTHSVCVFHINLIKRND